MKQFLLVALCVIIYGCNSFNENNYKCDESRSYPYWTDWTGSGLISIVDDSSAIVETHKYKKGCMSYNMEETIGFRSGLFLVNYRTKKSPLLGDTLELKGAANYRHVFTPNGYLIDSSVFVFDLMNKEFGFWKIGEKTIKFSTYDIQLDPNRNRKDDFMTIRDISHWKNGKVFFQTMHDTGKSYVLDMEKKQVKFFDPSSEYKWITKKNCDKHLSYIDNKIVCVSSTIFTNPSTDFSELIIDNVAADTINHWNITAGAKMFGNYIALGRKSEFIVVKIDAENLKFDKDFELWITYNPLKFYKDINNPDDFVSYSVEDLFKIYD